MKKAFASTMWANIIALEKTRVSRKSSIDNNSQVDKYKQAGFVAFQAVEHIESRRLISKLFFDGKRHRVTPGYAVTGWHKAFRIMDGEHLKKEAECARPKMCANFGNLGFIRKSQEIMMSNF
jgi:hypothetical protein